MAGAVGACANAPVIPPADQPLALETVSTSSASKGMYASAPIFIRIFKEESELEIWKARDDGRFYHFKTYPICNWSGELGPKLSKATSRRPRASTRSPATR